MSENFKNPGHTVDIIIEHPLGGIVIVHRKNAPIGWALPGGFVEYGEALWDTAFREAKEETSLTIELVDQLYTYSDPLRHPPRHVLSTVFIARGAGMPRAGNDVTDIRVCPVSDLPPLEFDHMQMIEDYLHYKGTGKRPYPLHPAKTLHDRLKKAG